MILTSLQETLAHAHGLAMAASTTIEEVEQRVDPAGQAKLRRMHDECGELRVRCRRAEAAFGDAAAEEMNARAQRTNERGTDLVGGWFTNGTEALEAWMFLAMMEAAQVVAWRSLADLASADSATPALRELIGDALAMGERHLQIALARG